MARTPTLSFDRGTLILHPPPRGKAWVDFATWDDRVEKFRIPALQYRSLVAALKDAGTEVNDKAKGFGVQPFEKAGAREPLAHQAEALTAWLQGGRRGTDELPTNRFRQNLLGTAGDAGHPQRHADRGTDFSVDAPVVRRTQNKLRRR